MRRTGLYATIEGRPLPALFLSRLACCLLVAIFVLTAAAAPGLVPTWTPFSPPSALARDLSSRLGGAKSPSPTSPEPAAEQADGSGVGALTEVVVLPEAAPLAADGAGQLLTVRNTGDGYAVMRFLGWDDRVEIVYRRKSAHATSIALGHDGTICVGLVQGVDCIDPQGLVHHHVHESLTNVVSLALAADGHLWVLRSAAGGANRLGLVRADLGAGRIETVLSFRQNIEGFTGNGMVALSDDSVVIPVVENGVHRLLRVGSDGALTRIGDYFNLSGAIAAGAGDFLYVAGVKRPQSLKEQQNPHDAVFVHPPGSSPSMDALFPLANGGSLLTGHIALGGSGELYLIRRQRVPRPGEPAREMPVLWRVDVGRPSIQGEAASAIDFRIPYIDALIDPRVLESEYAGPILIGRGQPLIVHGGNFDGKEGVARLFIGGVPSPIDFWTSDVIVVSMPEGVEGGEREVRVAIDAVVSDPETIEVKTSETPGWFQIGSPGLGALLANHLTIVAYNGVITIEGTTDTGEKVQRHDSMEPPGYYHLRLPNGEYEARFAAAYVNRVEIYAPGGEYVGSEHHAVTVPEQTIRFHISDKDPIFVWRPEMFGSN